MLFGNENAIYDDLLDDCHVTPYGAIADKAILRGRWGVGKTGHLLYRNKPLTEVLAEIDELDKYLWYRDEGGLIPTPSSV